MKQKYVIARDKEKKELVIREFAELDKDALSPLCEEIYDAKIILSAIKAGKDTLIRVLRTKNMYPPGIYANQIADAVQSIFAAKDPESVELFFDDIELINQDQQMPETPDELESESEEIDELLEIFGFFLLVLIGIELLETIKAYLATNVIHVEIVLEVALIAIARKVIILDIDKYESLTLVGIAALISAVSLAFLVIKRHTKPNEKVRR